MKCPWLIALQLSVLCLLPVRGLAQSAEESRIKWPSELAKLKVGKTTQYRGSRYFAKLEADATGWKTLILIKDGREISQTPVGECLRVAMIDEKTAVPTFCVWGKRSDGRVTRIYLNRNVEGLWKMSHMEFFSTKPSGRKTEGEKVWLEGKEVEVYFHSVFDGGGTREVLRNRVEN